MRGFPLSIWPATDGIAGISFNALISYASSTAEIMHTFLLRFQSASSVENSPASNLAIIMKFSALALAASFCAAIEATTNFRATTSVVNNQFSALATSLARLQALADRKGHAHISSRCSQARSQISQCQSSWQGISSGYFNSPWLARSSPHAPIVQNGLKDCGDFLAWLQIQPQFSGCPEYREAFRSCQTNHRGCYSGCQPIWEWPAPPKPSSGSHSGHYKRHTSLRDCPAHETACPMAVGSKSIECIDTKTEITSCGGCVSRSQGENCLDIVGADEVGCSDGNCVVFSTLRGYKLSKAGRPMKA
ncbi:hypothetical protein O181_067740 [Austropuccinia psidii MF-1]|uniref:Protein CPL1-like domain-containing protein n=1 Tax=Austropuccinia psidii MF-1 TaxID=1389203 RepID=A0A9Q3I6E5_9BASI|nr:hypothetical protein [Austropuccinia psidii MF-1]